MYHLLLQTRQRKERTETWTWWCTKPGCSRQ